MAKKLDNLEKLTLLSSCPNRYLSTFTELVDLIFNGKPNNLGIIRRYQPVGNSFSVDTLYRTAEVLTHLDSENIAVRGINKSGFRKIRITLEHAIYIIIHESYPDMISLSFPQENYRTTYEWDLEKDLSNFRDSYNEAMTVFNYITVGPFKNDTHSAISAVCKNKNQIVGGSGRVRLKNKPK